MTPTKGAFGYLLTPVDCARRHAAVRTHTGRGGRDGDDSRPPAAPFYGACHGQARRALLAKLRGRLDRLCRRAAGRYEARGDRSLRASAHVPSAEMFDGPGHPRRADPRRQARAGKGSGGGIPVRPARARRLAAGPAADRRRRVPTGRDLATDGPSFARVGRGVAGELPDQAMFPQQAGERAGPGFRRWLMPTACPAAGTCGMGSSCTRPTMAASAIRSCSTSRSCSRRRRRPRSVATSANATPAIAATESCFASPSSMRPATKRWSPNGNGPNTPGPR